MLDLIQYSSVAVPFYQQLLNQCNAEFKETGWPKKKKKDQQSVITSESICKYFL